METKETAPFHVISSYRSSYEERVRDSFARQPFMDYIGSRLVVLRPGYCVIHLP